MNLSQLQYFCKLAELQHYTRAAEQLHITQPTLSNSIAHLEKELGVPLFEREGRNVRLTKYGREFCRYAMQALESLAEGMEIAREQTGRFSGNVDVGTVYTIQDHYLPDLVRAYRDRYSADPRLNIYQGLTPALIEGLESNRYDVVFAARMEGKKHLTFVPVLNQKLVMLVHSKSPLAAKPCVRLADVRNRYLVTYRSGTPIGDKVQNLLDAEGLSPRERCDDEITLASMVDVNEDAVGLCLDTLGRFLFDDLTAVPVSDVPDDFHSIYLVYEKSRYKTPAVQHFIDLARSFKWRKG